MSENPLDQQIKEQGEVVRRLKAAKEPKEKVRSKIETHFPWKNREWKIVNLREIEIAFDRGKGMNAQVEVRIVL